MTTHFIDLFFPIAIFIKVDFYFLENMLTIVLIF